MRVAVVIAAAALAAGCGRCGGGSRPADGRAAPGAIAVVNGDPIDAAAVARELRDAQAGDEGSGAPAAGAALRRRALEDLVDRVLLLQEARARSIVVGQDQVERAFLRLRAEYPGTHLDDLLAQQRISEAELKARLKEQLTIERLFEQEVFPKVQVADAEIARYYEGHAGEFEEPERVHALQVVVASREEAVQLREKLRRNPQTFADVARKSSIAPEGRSGGDLGFIGRGSGFPEVFDVVFGMAPGTLSDVVASPYGFHVFKVVEKKPAQRRSLEQASPLIAEKLRRERRAGAQAEHLEALRKSAKIQIDEKALAAVTP